MNNKQKAFLITGVVSFTIFFITMTFYSLESPFFDLKNIATYTFGSDRPEPRYVIRSTNWLGIISTGTLIGSVFGFFLFKNK